jgi:L-threonylcarbamoyladenylate synthase
MMASPLRISDDDFEDAVGIATAILKSGGLIAYPTDTVYGIGCDATSEEAVARVLTLKGIGQKKPLSVMVADFGMIDHYCETGIWEDIVLKRYLPGPYTFILRQHRPLPASGTGKLGVRMPDSAFCMALCEKFGRPIVTTSANLTGQPPPLKFGDIDRKILDSVQAAIDGGKTKYGRPSLIIDLVDRKLIREGGDEIDLIGLPEI